VTVCLIWYVTSLGSEGEGTARTEELDSAAAANNRVNDFIGARARGGGLF